MTLTLGNIIAIVVAVLTLGSMCAAIVIAKTARKNARIAEQAKEVAVQSKEQAKQATLLEPRSEAIEHIRLALSFVEANENPEHALSNIRKAMHLSELFGDEVQKALKGAESKARHLTAEYADKRKKQDFQDMLKELGKELGALLEQMKQEAALKP